jgi:hypothetical protein
MMHTIDVDRALGCGKVALESEILHVEALLATLFDDQGLGLQVTETMIQGISRHI